MNNDEDNTTRVVVFIFLSLLFVATLGLIFFLLATMPRMPTLKASATMEQTRGL